MRRRVARSRDKAPSRGTRRASVGLDALEPRALLAADLRFAVIGDYGSGIQSEADVARTVGSWNPAFVTTVGDNNYPAGSAATIDQNVGQFYHGFLGPYNGNAARYGPGSADGQNHFFPSLGTSDWQPGVGSAQPYLDYFKGDLPAGPGNGRYYSVSQGNVELFVLDSLGNEPDGTAATSQQALWLQGELAKSTAAWKLVVMHTPAYSSGVVGNSPTLQWPFQAWGATAVLSGQDHDYERLSEGGLPYFVDGVGGESVVPITTPLDPGSQARYTADYGAMLIDATDTAITFEFVSRTGQVIDSSTVRKAGAVVATPAAPTGLVATAASPTQLDLSWSEASAGVSGFRVERAADGGSYAEIGRTAAGVTTFQDPTALPGVHYTYRVRAWSDTTPISASAHSEVDSAFGIAAGVATPALPAAPVTYLSALAWSPSSTATLPVLGVANLSVNGNPLSVGGVSYSQGVGTHSNSSLVYGLNGQYSYFLADVGVDDEQARLGNQASVDFQVFADGVKVYDSGLMLTGAPAQHVDLNVNGVRQLTLVVTDAGDGTTYDSADWANARLYGLPPTPTTPPTTSATPSGPVGSNGWYTGPVTVSFTASTTVSPPPALTTSFSLDGGKTWATGSSVSLAKEGVNTVLYDSTDAFGNKETPKTLVVKVDSAAPVTTATPTGARGADGRYTGPVAVSLSAVDATSGVVSIAYKVDSGASQVYSAPFTVSGDGNHTVTFFSTDLAGNQEAAQTLPLVIASATTPPPTNPFQSSYGILLLDPSGRGALSVTGNGSLAVTGGEIAVNSSDSSAGVVSGNGRAVANDFVAPGGIVTSGNGSTRGGVVHKGATADPLASLAAPAPPAATFSAVHYGGDGATVLSPGTYVGGIQIDGSGLVTLKPGLYYLKGGGLSVNGKASVTGIGVTIYNAPGGPHDAVNVSTKGLVLLTPPTSGAYQGVTLFEDRHSSAPINVSGQGLVTVAGTVYAPGATLNVSGKGNLLAGSVPGGASAHLIVADLTLSGNGNLSVDMTGVALRAGGSGSGSGASDGGQGGPGDVAELKDDQDGNNGNGEVDGKKKKH